MKTPVLTIPEYRKRFVKFVEEIMRKDARIASLEKSLDEENRLRSAALRELLEYKEKFGKL